ncbi:MAG: hypothetical protein RMJ87_13025 [Cytophagales bacterium]|nr:hypothetical protein [Bernardetiaceae bacterium]MDW8205945.1 hypothetical protein [Cytophagales bacterium]
MCPKQAEAYTFLALEPHLSEQSFVMLPALKQFRKTTSTGFQNIILSFSGRNETFLEVNIGVRHHAVEEIAQQFLDNLPEFRQEANTLVVSIGKLADTKYFRYKINCQDDIQHCAQQIMDFMHERGFHFLNESGSLANLNKIFNEHPQLPVKYLYNQIHRCFKGIIVARMCHHPQFVPLVETYFEVLQRLGAPERTLMEYDRLANYLLHYCPN